MRRKSILTSLLSAIIASVLLFSMFTIQIRAVQLTSATGFTATHLGLTYGFNSNLNLFKSGSKNIAEASVYAFVSGTTSGAVAGSFQANARLVNSSNVVVKESGFFSNPSGTVTQIRIYSGQYNNGSSSNYYCSDSLLKARYSTAPSYYTYGGVPTGQSNNYS